MSTNQRQEDLANEISTEGDVNFPWLTKQKSLPQPELIFSEIKTIAQVYTNEMNEIQGGIEGYETH
jgi:hypothetical protein